LLVANVQHDSGVMTDEEACQACQ